MQNTMPCGAGQLYGYDYDQERRMRREDIREADVVRRMFADAAAGIGVSNIGECLNKHCIPTKRGRTWDRRAVRRILSNQAYTGRDFYGKNCNASKI